MKWYNIGKIVNTHGIRGEIKVMSRTDFPEERFVKGNEVAIFPTPTSEPLLVKIATVRNHKGFYLLTLEGYTNINDVEKYKGCLMKIAESAQTALPEGEYYYHQIVGCTVTTTDGMTLGTIKEILSPGANDVWVVQGEKKKEYYIPYIAPVVKTVDVATKTITIELLEGLID
ncbi:MAG: ribosome maturation factor RimM [Bacilli bacterium]